MHQEIQSKEMCLCLSLLDITLKLKLQELILPQASASKCAIISLSRIQYGFHHPIKGRRRVFIDAEEAAVVYFQLKYGSRGIPLR